MILLSLRLVVMVLYTTGPLTNLGLALGRRVRLWLQLLVQAAVVAAALPRTDQLCRTPGLMDPSAEHLLGAAYDGLRWPMQLMPLPGSLLSRHTAHGHCRWVLADHGWGMAAVCLVARAVPHTVVGVNCAGHAASLPSTLCDMSTHWCCLAWGWACSPAGLCWAWWS